jgi:hypothetical protein
VSVRREVSDAIAGADSKFLQNCRSTVTSIETLCVRPA